MTRYTLSKADLEAHLEGAKRRLARSCDAFDAGDGYAVTEIATVLRLMLHDSKSSKSLLGQLGLKSKPFFDSTPDFARRPGGTAIMPGLAMFQLDDKGVVPIAAALIQSPRRRIAFKPWWEAKVCIIDQLEFSRSDLVWMVAGKTGAHIDAEISTDHHAISTGIGLPYHVSTAQGPAPIPDLEKACTRGIAAEVLLTLA
ncbi:MAG: hypothetical protein KKC14_05315 [Alphaproteobacteria bacterium]|nr:hypothetical protein [Alphaproteobacteria bacterium]